MFFIQRTHCHSFKYPSAVESDEPLKPNQIIRHLSEKIDKKKFNLYGLFVLFFSSSSHSNEYYYFSAIISCMWYTHSNAKKC